MTQWVLVALVFFSSGDPTMKDIVDTEIVGAFDNRSACEIVRGIEETPSINPYITNLRQRQLLCVPYRNSPPL
jgi:hypothetical protein